jgi:xanthine dehydrogenase YagS FAD-binding subunit
MLPNFSYVAPPSLKEAVKHLASEGAVVHAGGTDLLGCLRDQVFPARKVVSLSRLRELRGIQETPDGGLRLGALTTLTEVTAASLIRERYPALARGAAEAASPQLRHQGTIGGNLCQKPRCWYYRGEFHCLRKGGEMCYAIGGENQYHCLFGGEGCYIVHPSDTAPALLALKARLRLFGPRGGRVVAADKFFVAPAVNPRRETILEPGEILTEILLPKPVKGLRSSYRKIRARASWDFALAGLALALRFEEGRVGEARVVLSGAAPVPWRSLTIEKEIAGTRLDPETIARAAAAGVKDSQPLERNGYKVPLFQGLIEEELRAAARA